MKALAEFTRTTLIGGILVLLPVYLAVLLLMKALGAVMALVAPVTVGEVQIDCAVTQGYAKNHPNSTPAQDPWGLVKAARLRLPRAATSAV